MSVHKFIFYLPFITMALLLLRSDVHAQESEGEKEVIIIEKTIDQNGNVISKSTKRYNGIYNEDDIQELLKEEPLPPSRSFDLEGLGFGDEFQEYFQPQQKRPTIGVNLNFKEGRATVEKVIAGSGAEEADIRIGDLLLSINGIAISSLDDIYLVLDEKQKGDRVQLVLFRDGQELEKEVTLGLRGNSGFFFEFPDGGSFNLFENGELGIFPQNMDSLLKLFPGLGEYDGLNLERLRPLERPSKVDSEDTYGERPTLGVYIDETSSEIKISEIIKDSAADRAGLQAEDIILRIDDNIVSRFREVSDIMNTKKKGDKMTIQINRSGVIIQKEVTLD